jgi:hypothetical protein
MVVLHFEDWGYDGFRLEDKSINPLKLSEHEELSSFYPEIETSIDEKGNIRFFTFEIWKSIEQLDNLLKDSILQKIPGYYTVPELGIENVSFIEVLKTIKKYYEKKLKRRIYGKTRKG